jgi:AraC family transcriptional regulator
MSAKPTSEPEFFTAIRKSVALVELDERGTGENWCAPVAIMDAPHGIGEETWLESVPDTVIAWQLAGADVRCEWGPKRGTVLEARRQVLALQPKGTPNHYSAKGRMRSGQFVIPDQLLARVALDLNSQHTSPASLRTDLIGLNDAPLINWLNEYAARSRSAEAPPSRLEMEARALLIVERLITQHHAQPRKRQSGGLAPRHLKRVTDYLMEHLSEEVALAELAAIAGLTPHHFCRAFKQSTGLPPHAWLTARRMERAKEMMAAHPGMGLTEIALCAGYSSQTTFGIAFKRTTGMTPSQWRREQAL